MSKILQVRNIEKRYGSVTALAGVSLSVERAEIHGLIGHNGSGKSTLTRIIAGVTEADSGTIEVHSDDPSVDAGSVAVVFQDLGLADGLSVLDNIRVNRTARNRLGLVRWKEESRLVGGILGELNVRVDLSGNVGDLRPSDRIMISVARALLNGGWFEGLKEQGGVNTGGAAKKASLLLVDEATSGLPRTELERLRALLLSLRDRHEASIVLVSHNPQDVRVLCDSFTALRNGLSVGSFLVSEVSMGDLGQLMAGADISIEASRSSTLAETGVPRDAGTERARTPRKGACAKTLLLSLKGVRPPSLPEPISLDVAAGEVVGVTGLEGSGFRELIRTIVGVDAALEGEMEMEGRTVAVRSPIDFWRQGGVFIPGDRARTSGIQGASSLENMMLGARGRHTRWGVLNLRKEKEEVAEMLRRLHVMPARCDRVLGELSGGQQQKVVIGRALVSSARIFVLEEPTVAIDVGARTQIIRLLREDIAGSGAGVVVASSEYEMLSSLCDRVVVFSQGRVSDVLMEHEVSEPRILGAAYRDDGRVAISG